MFTIFLDDLLREVLLYTKGNNNTTTTNNNNNNSNNDSNNHNISNIMYNNINNNSSYNICSDDLLREVRALLAGHRDLEGQGAREPANIYLSIDLSLSLYIYI